MTKLNTCTHTFIHTYTDEYYTNLFILTNDYYFEITEFSFFCCAQPSDITHYIISDHYILLHTFVITEKLSFKTLCVLYFWRNTVYTHKLIQVILFNKNKSILKYVIVHHAMSDVTWLHSKKKKLNYSNKEVQKRKSVKELHYSLHCDLI